jgi:CheY-like chemotaxis protein
MMARVLVVEDDRDVLLLLERRLRSYGHLVVAAQSGRLALRAVGVDTPVDVAVVDFHLPGMDGVQLVRELRRHPELSDENLPAVILTGDNSSWPNDAAQSEGIACLSKPFVSGELQGAILNAMAAAQAEKSKADS